ncbi:MAG: FecR family protein, partial [Rhodothermales bacterium]
MEPVKSPPLPAEVQAQLRKRSAEDQRQAERVWHLLEDADAVPADVPSTDAAWTDLAHQLDAVSSQSPHARTRDRLPQRRRPSLRLIWAIGSLAALALLIGLGWWMRPVSVTVPPGQTLTVELPDGSDVQLNSGSRLAYRRGFARWPFVPSAQRLVSLQGEAFFEVQPGGRPFVVETFNAHVEVLGTRFNVRAWLESRTSATRVTLAEGKVRAVRRDAPGPDVVLSEPGQMAQ